MMQSWISSIVLIGMMLPAILLAQQGVTIVLSASRPRGLRLARRVLSRAVCVAASGPTRCLLCLSPVLFQIAHIKGKTQCLPDSTFCLSEF